jgi:hypothetical protein
MDANSKDKRQALVTSALDKVRAALANASPDLSVVVTLDMEEALTLLSLRPARPGSTPTYIPRHGDVEAQLSAYGLPPVHFGQGE